MIAIFDMTDASPAKPPRGSWHEKAREMRDQQNLTYSEIGYRLGVSGPAVYFALNPGRRKGRKKGAEAVTPAPLSS